MREEERNDLRAALKEVHDRVHDLYPRGHEMSEKIGKDLRDRLLVIDLAVHLADEVIAAASFEKEKVVERTANLLYGVKLLAPGHGLEEAAALLLADPNEAAPKSVLSE